MVKLERKVFSFEIDGKEYKVNSPKIKQVDAFQKKIKDNDSIDSTIEFLSELGLPKEVCLDLEVEQLGVIVETISSQKKN